MASPVESAFGTFQIDQDISKPVDACHRTNRYDASGVVLFHDARSFPLAFQIRAKKYWDNHPAAPRSKVGSSLDRVRSLTPIETDSVGHAWSVRNSLTNDLKRYNFNRLVR